MVGPVPVRTTASALRLRSLPVVADTTDTGLRLVHGQTAEAYGESWDQDWQWVKAPQGEGWASAAFLEPAPATARPDPSWPRVPHGLVQIREVFGPPATPDATAGMVNLPVTLPLSWVLSQRVSRFACHRLVEAPMQSAFDEIYRRDLWGLLEDFGGCYNDRTARGTSKTSTHAWGIAVDLNTRTNPLGRTPAMDSRIVGIFEDRGFLWGGRWSRPDGMHFQYATGY